MSKSQAIKNSINKSRKAVKAGRRSSLKGKARKLLSMPTDVSLVLQQVLVNGNTELVNLSETLNISRSRLAHIVTTLKSKGLIKIDRSYDDAMFVRLSNRGRRLVMDIWPESAMAAA